MKRGCKVRWRCSNMSNDTRPEIRFPGFTEDWEERKLGDIFVYKQGQQVPVENQFTKRGKNRHRFIRIVDLTTNNEAPRYIEYSGDNIISSTDLFMIRYGQPGVIGYGYEGVIANNLFKLIPKIETYNLFFKYILDSMYPKIQSLSSSTTMPAISFKSLDVLAVRYPDKKEQEKIGSFFAQLDNTIALHQRKLDLLKETKKGFLQKMFPKNGEKVPEIRFPGFTEDWEQRKLGDYTDLITKGTTPKDKANVGEVTFVKVENISDGKINSNSRISIDEHENYLRRSKLKENDILFSIAGTLGRTAMVDKSILPANTNQALSIIRGYKFDTDFLLTSLNGKVVNDFIRKNPTIGAQPNLSLEQVGSLIIWTPSKDEQQQIGNFFRQLESTIALHQRKLDLLKETKKGFLQKMFV
ncbi:restriction endonuclease subunit S [Enterococcus faecium]|nr:restriction endonuclease subunit S [Enterococcus faecium]